MRRFSIHTVLHICIANTCRCSICVLRPAAHVPCHRCIYDYSNCFQCKHSLWNHYKILSPLFCLHRNNMNTNRCSCRFRAWLPGRNRYIDTNYNIPTNCSRCNNSPYRSMIYTARCRPRHIRFLRNRHRRIYSCCRILRCRFGFCCSIRSRIHSRSDSICWNIPHKCRYNVPDSGLFSVPRLGQGLQLSYMVVVPDRQVLAPHSPPTLPQSIYPSQGLGLILTFSFPSQSTQGSPS